MIHVSYIRIWFNILYVIIQHPILYYAIITYYDGEDGGQAAGRSSIM